MVIYHGWQEFLAERKCFVLSHSPFIYLLNIYCLLTTAAYIKVKLKANDQINKLKCKTAHKIANKIIN